MGMTAGWNGNNRWEWEGNGNEHVGTGGTGIKKTSPLISSMGYTTA